ncbi:hypothetical protein F4775DRAFT_600683 [Biscogniauxia sp. FL1348]|nr:hypothetical protein F4775DRAFT_600683 [Biscogniauxia sp. FL1348]
MPPMDKKRKRASESEGDLGNSPDKKQKSNDHRGMMSVTLEDGCFLVRSLSELPPPPPRCMSPPTCQLPSPIESPFRPNGNTSSGSSRELHVILPVGLFIVRSLLEPPPSPQEFTMPGCYYVKPPAVECPAEPTEAKPVWNPTKGRYECSYCSKRRTNREKILEHIERRHR